MSAEVEVVEAFLAGLASDLDLACALLADDAVIDEAHSLSFGGVRKGPDGFRSMIEHLNRDYRLRMGRPQVRDADDLVVVTLDLELTARATGRSTAMSVVDLYTVEDGRITRLDVFYKDTHAVIDILGAPDAPDTGSTAA